MHHHFFLPFFSRFDNHGGGWGYSGHSIEAIRFMVDTGNSLSDQQNIFPINPKYENRLLYELHVQYVLFLVHYYLENKRTQKLKTIRVKFEVQSNLGLRNG